MKLSVVIPTYNRKESLRCTLDGLARQNYPFDDFEAVVVSDGSTDGTAEMLAEYVRSAPYALQVVCQANGGPSRARNRGIQEARHDVIVFLDDDVEPVPEFLSRHAMHHRQNPKIAVLGPMSPDPARSAEEPVWIAWEHSKLQDIYAMFRPGGAYAGQPAGPMHFYSGNASIHKQWLLAAKGFDENYTRQEDVELAVRMQQASGVTFQFDFAADGLHRPQRSFKSWLRIPTAYGDFDSQRIRAGLLSWDDVHENINKRNRMTRALARMCLTAPPLLPVCVALLRGASLTLYRLHSKDAALSALSALYNVCYINAALKKRVEIPQGHCPPAQT
jgi:glycosyltransferase involved in cell wall biosynthesis